VRPLSEGRRLWGVHSPKVFTGVDFLMGKKFLFAALILLICYSHALGQSEDRKEIPNIYAVAKDGRGEILEGYLRSQPEEITVTSEDNKEKSIPTKYLKSITLEKIRGEGAGSDRNQEARYSVRIQNSQEIYTLRKKYTFSLNTNVGVITRSIDPETINTLLSKDASQGSSLVEKEKPFIQDKSVVFSLEFKF